MQREIILASTSPRRRQLLQQLEMKFKIIKSNYHEDMGLKKKSAELAKFLALGKARDVAKKTKKGIVIGADTFLSYKEKLLGKPKDKQDAKRILKLISNKILDVYSGIAIIDVETNKTITDSVKTSINIKKLSDKDIDNYISSGEPLDKAGAIGIQERGAIFVEKISGCYFNIVGLPLFTLYKHLEKLGVNIFENGNRKSS